MNKHIAARAISFFIDVMGQRRLLGSKVDTAVSRVLQHCQFINDPRSRSWRLISLRSPEQNMSWPAPAGPIPS